MPNALALLLGALVAGGLVGCTPSIGDKCTLSTDCSIQGTRSCDTSQTAGYCTVLGCTADTCPDNAACVEFGASIPGCPYDDYRAPSRTGRPMCMKACGSDSDCRQNDGYACLDPRTAPWNAVLLDNARSKRVCIARPSGSAALAMASFADAAVCSPNRPPVVDLDAAVAAQNGGDADDAGEGGEDADTGVDADAADEAQPDGTLDAASDSSATDVQGGD
jgi:hypothetical protein